MLRFHDSLTGTIRPFVPVEPDHVRMYVCGPTVYDHAHIGHARSEVFFDVVKRYLRFVGHRVTHVRNFTDMDDKIIECSHVTGKGVAEIANRFIDAYHADMDNLNVVRPDHEPRVTEHIEAMRVLINRLVRSGHAYVREGNVLFRVRSLDDYGLLAPAGRWCGVPEESAPQGECLKDDERDFVLWKKVHDNGPVWESLWGMGRPGWHIECVAMGQHFLGKEFDIHGGGQDLVFPHHENERALSMSFSGTPLARYWIHHALVTSNNQKLSRSSGTPYLIRDLCRGYRGEAVRLFILSTHYRRALDFTFDRIRQASSALGRLYGAVYRWHELLDIPSTPVDRESPLVQLFCQAMDRDLNIPNGINIVFSALRRLNKTLQDQGNTGNAGLDDREDMAALVMLCRDVLGILPERKEGYIRDNLCPGCTARQGTRIYMQEDNA